MKQEKGHPQAAEKHTDSHYADLSAEAQRKRLIDALRCGPITTIEARRNLDILMPAARVHELKHRHGFDIQTIRVRQETDCGKLHSVAKYVLVVGGVI
ncbi:MAG: hypothetical protein HGA71_07000 [Azonexaceae bacterium]|nr:hypothetical protein [Azonexaceae bacterium]